MADRTNQTPERLAIIATLQGRWEDAIGANLEILVSSPHDAAALNRLGIAYLKTKQTVNAKKAFQKVLSLDSFNSIAKTNLKKLSPKFSNDYDNTSLLSNHTFSFIEEPGKSKVIPLANLGEPNIIATLFTGLEVELKIAARKVKVTTKDKYIGSLPDDISIHLIRLIKAGYKYQTLIKSADTDSVQVYIKEIKNSKKLKGIPSFTFTQNLDDLDISSGNGPTQPPLEIYDPVIEPEN
ncbi:tetratricopeptide repeat protein [Candidatus Collierbacteria bacterium]|nr:tetratricopeptide repeat protein [Candidatus Collierbacteria bacterium]